MTPVEPDTKPPFQSIVETFGFHEPHLDMSDHTRHTWSGEALVSTDVPYSRAICLSPFDRLALDGCQSPHRRRLGCLVLVQVEANDHPNQKPGADVLRPVPRLLKLPPADER